MKMPENTDYAVFSIMGCLVIIFAVVVAINTALVIHLWWLIGENSWYMAPMAILIIGFDLMVVCGVLYAMGIGD